MVRRVRLVVVMLRFRVLGPIEVVHDGQSLPLGPPKQQLVLAALLVDVGRPVSTETLLDRVWDRVPDEPRPTLYAYVTRVRQLLRRAGAGTILRRTGGYLLDVDPQTVDLHVVNDLLRGVAGRPDPPAEEQCAALAAALTHWRRPALAGLTGIWAERLRDTLEQRWLDTVLQWARAELTLGRPAPVIEALPAVLADHPLAEAHAAVLLRALHLDGRTTDALAQYGQLRQRYADELGSEPGRELRDVHQLLLRDESGSTALTTPNVPPPGRAAGLPVPRQLPADVAGLVGRDRELRLLDKTLTRSGDRPVIAVLSGTAGVGKTALATRWAHRAASDYPDGQLYVDLRGYDPDLPVLPTDALAGFLRALGVTGVEIATEPAERAAQWRSIVADRQVLIVLDNAKSTEQVRPLLPGAAGCAVLVTSRDSLVGLVARHGAQRLGVDLLPAADATALLIQLIGDRVRSEPDAVGTLAEQCARLPLALRIAAELAAERRDAPLAELTAELADEARRLDQLDAGDDAHTAVVPVFSWSYRGLPDPAARAFRLLSLHPATSAAPAAVAALLGGTDRDAQQQLDQLIRAHLVQRADGRVALHDLLRAYAARRGADDPPGERTAAANRLLRHYVDGVRAATATLYPTALPNDGSNGGPVFTAAQARSWLDVELDTLLAVGATAAAAEHVLTGELADALSRHLESMGALTESLTLLSGALRGAERRAEAGTVARLLDDRGRVYWRLGRYAEAEEDLRRSLAGYLRLDDHAGEAGVLGRLGNVHLQQGRGKDALDDQQRSLAAAIVAADPGRQAEALANLGTVHMLRGSYRPATEQLEQALLLHRRTGNRGGEAFALSSLGNVHRYTGRYDDAVRCFTESLAVRRAAGSRAGEADALGSLAELALLRGQPAEAQRMLETALEIFREIGDRNGEANALSSLGMAHLHQGGRQRAVTLLAEALAVARAAGDRAVEAEIANGLGEVRATLNPGAAAEDFRDAQQCARDAGDRIEEIRALLGLANLAYQQAEYPQAIDLSRAAIALAPVENRRQRAAALECLGTALAGSGDAAGAAAANRDALSLYGQLGATDDADRIRARLTGDP